MSITLEQAGLDRAAVTELADGFRGEIVRPDDAGFDDRRRIWNASVDRRPSLIARCAGTADVLAAVRYARKTGVLTAVRSGGHSLPGHSVCDGGLVIDLGPMKGIRVDPDARTAQVQAGVLLGELDRETQAFGLVVPAGMVTHTGVAGLTLGGGMGWTMRKYGLTIDQLRSVDLVTAEGALVRANERENPDLFWGVRGGGGNFGIVTSFEFALNPLGPVVLAGPIAWDLADAPRLLRFYREWIKELPDEMTTVVTLRRVPAVGPWPAELHGRRVVMIGGCYAGDLGQGERVLRPLRRFGSPVLDGCGPKPFVVHQASIDAGVPWGWHYYFRGCDVAELSDEVVDITVEHCRRIRSPRTSFPIFQLGGAVARVAEDATAFHGRSAGHVYNIGGISETADGFPAEREWARGLWEALRPFHTGTYVNFMQDEGEQRVREAYGDPKYNRLKALKRQWDPQNVFRLNQNIAPD